MGPDCQVPNTIAVKIAQGCYCRPKVIPRSEREEGTEPTVSVTYFLGILDAAVSFKENNIERSRVSRSVVIVHSPNSKVYASVSVNVAQSSQTSAKRIALIKVKRKAAV
jgi:hypothetical protein